MNISENSICAGGCDALSEGLRVNQSVTVLDLSKCSLGNIRCLCDVLATHSYVKELYLSDNGLGEEACQQVAQMLKVNRTITMLDIRRNKMDSSAVADALMVNRSLKVLRMSYCQIGDEGAKVIAEALKWNYALVDVDISNNNIEMEGAKAFSDVLKVNQNMTALNLAQYSMTAQGVGVICDALKVNQTLKRLEICLCDSELGVGFLAGAFGSLSRRIRVEPLIDALETNGSIVSIDLDYAPPWKQCRRNALMHSRARESVVTLLVYLTRRVKQCCFQKT